MTITHYVPAKTHAERAYEAYLHSFRWTCIVRPARLWWDGHRCRFCDAPRTTGNPLNVHHTPTAYLYKGWGNGGLLDVLVHPGDVLGEIMHTITLCEKHHHKIHEG